jgi:hypothetical protein
LLLATVQTRHLVRHLLQVSAKAPGIIFVDFFASLS